MAATLVTPSPSLPSIGRVAPKGGPLGLLPEVSRDALGFMTRCTRDYGDFVRVRLGLTPCVVIGHPDLVEEVLVTRNHDYRKGFATRRLGSLLGKGLLLSEGDFWLRQRRLMQPAFHRQRLSMMADQMVETASTVLDGWHDGETRAINQEMTEVTVRIVGRTLFGTDVGEDLDRIRAASRASNEHFRSRLFTMLTLVPDTVPTPGNLRYQRALHDLHTLVKRITAERRKSGIDGDDLLGMLLSARDDTGRGMDDRQLRDEVLTLLLAGHDTTALTLTWAFVVLARYPEVEERLHNEIRAAIGDRPPTPGDVSSLTFVEQVVTETLRLYPPAWAMGREALRDTEVGGQRVPRGTTVLISPWALHRDRRFWSEPETFAPDRWSNGSAQPAPRYAYVPFGAGQRVCIGANFAQLEAMLVLTTISQRYKLEMADAAREVEPWPVVTLRTRGDVLMRLCGRAAPGGPSSGRA
jgi:cytochrome P450